MPVRHSYRGWAVHLPHFLDWKVQSHGVPILLASPTEDPQKVLEKFTSSSSAHLQPLQIDSTSCLPTTRTLNPLSHHNRMGILQLTRPGTSPLSPRLVSLPPTNMLTRNIKPPTVHLHRQKPIHEPPENSLPTKVEVIIPNTVKSTGTYASRRSQSPRTPSSRCRPTYVPNTSSETYISSALQEGTAISVSYGYFKLKWGT